MTEQYTTRDVLDILGIPEHRRITADRRLTHLRRGRKVAAGKAVYTYKEELIEGVDFRYSGRTVLYSKAGLKKLRELFASFKG